MQNKIVAEDFTIKKNSKDFKKAIIERHNLTNEFTLEDIEGHEAELEKSERELTAQIRVTNAAIANVERNHPVVAKMSLEILNAAHYMSEAKELLQKSEAKLKAVKATKKKYKEVKDVVMKKFGFVESNVLENDESK